VRTPNKLEGQTLESLLWMAEVTRSLGKHSTDMTVITIGTLSSVQLLILWPQVLPSAPAIAWTLRSRREQVHCCGV